MTIKELYDVAEAYGCENTEIAIVKYYKNNHGESESYTERSRLSVDYINFNKETKEMEIEVGV